MLLALPPAGLIFVLGAAGETALAGAIAGAFTLVNTVLTAWLVREQRGIRRTLTAPRALVYDAAGRPVGTILELRGKGTE